METKRDVTDGRRERSRENAAEHDKWFRAQVDAGLAEADDPNTVWVSHEEVKEDMAKQRAILRAFILRSLI